MRPYLIILYLLVLVALGAAADALNNTGMGTIGHALGAVEVGGLLVGGLVLNLSRRDVFALLAAYVCFRIVGFDYTWNLVAGVPLGYHGESSLWDGFLSQFPHHGILFARAIFLITGVSIPFKFMR